MLRSVSSRLLASRSITAARRLPAAPRLLCCPPSSVFHRHFATNPPPPPPPSSSSAPSGSAPRRFERIEQPGPPPQSAEDAAAIAELQAQYPFPINFRPQELTPEEKNQADWAKFAAARMNLMVFALIIGGVLTVRYWYYRELDHFQHHRHRQEPYAFFINRDNEVAAGFWPGRSCQFLEFNCFASVYDQAEKMLKEKQGDEHHDAPAEGGDHHDDKKEKH